MKERTVRTAVVMAAALAACLLGPARPAQAQARGLPISPARPNDAIEHARALAMQPRPPLGPPPQVTERWVPEQRLIVPGTAQQIVIPAHQERVLSETQVAVPTLPLYGPLGTPPVIYPRDAPPADLRQGF